MVPQKGFHACRGSLGQRAPPWVVRARVAFTFSRPACQEKQKIATTPQPRHSNGVKTTVELDASNRIVLSRELRRAAGIPRRQKLIVSATPGRIVLEMEANASGRIIKRGKLKVWTGAVPSTPIDEAVDQSRHYTR